MSEHEFKFETKQLHVGQEQADPATDSRAVPIYLLHVLLIVARQLLQHSMQRTASHFAMPGTSMED